MGEAKDTVKGSGPKGRILTEDVQNFVKAELARPRGAGGGLGFLTAYWPGRYFSLITDEKNAAPPK